MRREENGPLGPMLLLVAAAIAAALVLGGVAVAAYQLTGTRAQSEDSAPTGPASGQASPKPGPREENTDPWRAAAHRFGVAFTTTEGGHSAWMRRLKPLVSPDLAQGYSYTDMSLVPTARLTRVTGGAEVTGETPARSAQLHYANGLVVDVTVAQVPTTQKWVITTAVAHEDTEEPAPPPAHHHQEEPYVPA